MHAPDNSAVLHFTHRTARVGAVTAGLALAVGIETFVVHLWLSARYPGWAWFLTALGGASLMYLAVEYRAIGRGAVRIELERVCIDVAGRVKADVPRAALSEARQWSWRDVPDNEAAAGYLNAMAPAEPNVLLVFTAPVPIGLAWGLLRRRVERLALRVDDPDGLLAILQQTSAI